MGSYADRPTPIFRYPVRMTAVVRAARFLQNRGVKTLFLEARHRAYARYYDRSLGIDTIALIEPEKMD